LSPLFAKTRETTALYQTLLSDATLYMALARLDEEIAMEAKAKGCRFCGGVLHNGRYPRKPRCVPSEVEDNFQFRASFCCSRKGCRRRTTPHSVRFLGRKVFCAAAVVLVTLLRHGPTPERLSRIRQLTGVSARTVARWRIWWQSAVPRTWWWSTARGFLRRPVAEHSMPTSLLHAFTTGNEKAELIALLRFVSPLTSASVLHPP
jgi:hypothetical protein